MKLFLVALVVLTFFVWSVDHEAGTHVFANLIQH